MSQDRLLTVREVAAFLRSSPETVRRWVRQGRLRGIRPGGTRLGYRISEEELKRFLALAHPEKRPPAESAQQSAD